jgi:hypothetical protein
MAKNARNCYVSENATEPGRPWPEDSLADSLSATSEQKRERLA